MILLVHVIDPIIVDLHHAQLDLDLQAILFVLEEPEQFSADTRSDARILCCPMNSVSLSTPCLSVRENAQVVAVYGALYQLLGLLKYVFLRVLLSCEYFVILDLLIEVIYDSFIYCSHRKRMVLLCFQLWPYATVNSYGPFCVLQLVMHPFALRLLLLQLKLKCLVLKL